MGNIQNAWETFRKMTHLKYNLAISHKKVLYEFELTFTEKEFYHLCGLQYIKDIDIPRNVKKLSNEITSGRLCDDYLETSKYYTEVPESYADVKSRINGLQYLENFIDNKNLIVQYVKFKNPYSCINADYLIKSNHNGMEACIFLRQRSRSNDFCLCSFFVNPECTYYGVNLYWLYKAKIDLLTGSEEVLYDRLHRNS